ncbi:MAG: hypothetical protein KTR24_06775 [Saprospiraceae bacterium]|nr:hypothetical protein [Saprospiraceae bacterium]
MQSSSVLLLHGCPIISWDISVFLEREGYNLVNDMDALQSVQGLSQGMLAYTDCLVIDSECVHMLEPMRHRGYCDLPILYLSQWDANEDLTVLPEFHMTKCLVKPFLLHQLRGSMRSLMGLSAH